jgi:hypothetical protein
MIDADKIEMMSNNEVIDLSLLSHQRDKENLDSYEDLDPEEYGEPPPSYKLAKYYPKATLDLESEATMISSTQLFSIIEPLLLTTGNNVAARQATALQALDESARSSNIYENIEDAAGHNSSELNSTAAASNRNNGANSTTSSRRARFQGLKKQHSSMHRTKQTTTATERTTQPDLPNLLMFSSASSSTSNSTHSSQVIVAQEKPSLKNAARKERPAVSHMLASGEKKQQLTINANSNFSSNEQFL